jgi:cysteine desulfurase
VIYLDYNATTPVDARVMGEMLPWFEERFANAASSHGPGRLANDAVDDARVAVADLMRVRPGEIVFTSGATEADNLALRGVLEACIKERPRLLVGATEHRAVLDTADALAASGAELSLIPVLADGSIDEDAYVRLLDERVGLVSLMWANNETGAIAPIERVAALAHKYGALFHSDVTQAVGKTEVDLRSAGVDLASLSAHKVYGPKGVGALFVKRGTRITAQITGGGHERGMRSGTLNVPAIVGFGSAARMAREMVSADSVRLRGLSLRLIDALREQISDVRLVAETAPRLPNTVNVRIVGADSEAVMTNAPGVAISSGSACSALVPDVSHVLLAMGMRAEQAEQCLRFSLGRPTTAEEIELAAAQIGAAARRVRTLSA